MVPNVFATSGVVTKRSLSFLLLAEMVEVRASRRHAIPVIINLEPRSENTKIGKAPRVDRAWQRLGGFGQRQAHTQRSGHCFC